MTAVADAYSAYREFIEKKILHIPQIGIKVQREEINPICFDHQKDVIQWALEGGCRAIFCSFGLGKTVMQLEIARLSQKHTGKPFLIGLPLGVVQEFKEDAEMLGIPVRYVQDMNDIFQCIEDLKAVDQTFNDGRETPQPIYLSNYERIREGKFLPTFFGGVSFDEGDAMRNLDTQTTDYIMTEFSKVPLRFLATATPTPNDYTEILNYAQFLGIMDRSQALTRFFQRNSTKAGDLTLYPHKEQEFWIWVRGWSIFIELPSDLGYSDEGYTLPKLNVHYHEVKVSERGDVIDRDGNLKMFADASKGLSEAAKEKRQSLSFRVQHAVNIVKASPDCNWILWHDLENERREIESALPDCRSVYGSQKQSEKERLLIGFKHNEFYQLATKPVIAGSGCNFQRHCHNAVFIGIGYKFKDFIQAIHRIYRFRQQHEVNIHIIYTDAERDVLKTLLAKWQRHNELVARMTAIMKEYGLSQAAAIDQLKRKIGVERKESSGERFKVINNDAVIEAATMETDSIGMILTSIPFSDQYEYCEIYNDMGHNNGDGEFFAQMDFLTVNLFRILKPGRIAAIHVKNRIVFSYQNGVGFTSLNDFRGKTVAHFVKHGFHLLGEHVITTDVVQENNQTYRLGWTENSKDGTKMGCGSPEYLLIFRKPPTDISNAYADEPVTKSKEDYTRGRWQLDAHAYWRSSGNRLLDPEELRKMDLSEVYKAWKAYASENPYDFETHVKICESLDSFGKLPSTFMAVPTPSNSDYIWDDISRMHTLNSSQSQRKQEKHVCPLQFDIVDRALIRYSNKGDKVYDPFGGIMTVPFRCIKLERYGIATELNEFYWKDGAKYCKEAEYKQSIPTLFDTVKEAV
jgi:DNA modification methylase